MTQKLYSMRYSDLMEAFEAFHPQQITLNKELMQEIRNQKEYIEKRLEHKEVIAHEIAVILNTCDTHDTRSRKRKQMISSEVFVVEVNRITDE